MLFRSSTLKILSDASSESIDAIMYRQMIGSLMYLKNMRLDIFFFWGRRVQLIMGSSMRQIRLTWKVMWIRIGQAVPLIGRALRGAASVWDHV